MQENNVSTGIWIFFVNSILTIIAVTCNSFQNSTHSTISYREWKKFLFQVGYIFVSWTNEEIAIIFYQSYKWLVVVIWINALSDSWFWRYRFRFYPQRLDRNGQIKSALDFCKFMTWLSFVFVMHIQKQMLF